MTNIISTDMLLDTDHGWLIGGEKHNANTNGQVLFGKPDISRLDIFFCMGGFDIFGWLSHYLSYYRRADCP